MGQIFPSAFHGNGLKALIYIYKSRNGNLLLISLSFSLIRILPDTVSDKKHKNGKIILVFIAKPNEKNVFQSCVRKLCSFVGC